MVGPWSFLFLLLGLLDCGGAHNSVLPTQTLARYTRVLPTQSVAPYTRVIPYPQYTQAQALDEVEIAKTKEVVNKLYGMRSFNSLLFLGSLVFQTSR